MNTIILSRKGKRLANRSAKAILDASPHRRPTWRLALPHVHHRKLPDCSALLAGSQPPDDEAFVSDRLQIWLNRTDETWQDPAPHFHTESDEIFIVLKGALVVEVDGERIRIEADELVAFAAGVVHSVVAVEPPVESLMIRAPSVADKVYLDPDETVANHEEQGRP